MPYLHNLYKQYLSLTTHSAFAAVVALHIQQSLTDLQSIAALPSDVKAIADERTYVCFAASLSRAEHDA